MLINNQNFLLGEIPEISPHSPERTSYWRNVKRQMVEGIWSSGKWCPPNLFFYANLWHIMLSTTKYSKTKKVSKPLFRDLEWEKSYILQEAKGFSGFSEDRKRTCFRIVDPINAHINRELYPELFDKYKDYEYVPARDYLRMNHGKDLGKPLYMNTCKNVIDIEARETGKSYFAASNIAHNFLTDGATDYDEYLQALITDTPFASETVVGAYDSGWSADLLSKVRLGLGRLPGSITYRGTYYPSPISKSFKGSFSSSETIEALYEYKKDGHWRIEGSGSKIQHRNFRNNPFAANGTRGNANYIEEVGFMRNLRRSLGALRDCVSTEGEQFGFVWMQGTGGDMEGRATEEAKKIFYGPEAFNCLVFNDEYENRGKIGYFIPFHKTMNEFRDENGVLDEERAKKKYDLIRKEIEEGSDKRAILDLKQNRPEVPSEAFIVDSGSPFDVAAIEDHIGWLKTQQDKSEIRGMYGELIINVKGDVEFIRDVKGKLEPASFPIPKGKQPDGCVVIWDMPVKGVIPYGMYIGSTDPYDQDKAPNTTSVGSTFIMQRFDETGMPVRKIVAEYSGRPRTAAKHHETVRRLLLLYNATDMYENEKNTMKMHFQKNGCLNLLANSPTILTSVDDRSFKKTSRARNNKGCHKTVPIHKELMLLLSDYLDEQIPDGSGALYLHTIRSVPALEELKSYNDDGNFDRVDSLLYLILYDHQMYKIRFKATQEENTKKKLFQNKLFTNYDEISILQNKTRSSFVDSIVSGDRKPLLPGMFNNN